MVAPRAGAGRTRSNRRRWLRLLLWSALVLPVAFAVTLMAILSGGTQREALVADVAIVLGARVYPDHLSTALRARLEVALQLHREGLAPRLIVSGGQGADEPSTEAMAMRDYLIARGVSPEVIHLEEQSYSTYDNLRNSLAVMDELGLGQAVLVTSDYHVLRSSLIARRLGLDGQVVGAPLPVSGCLRWRMLAREVLAVWKDLILLPWYRR